jgi:hypothetical protein
MLRSLNKTDRVTTTTFGGFCPYWTIIDGRVFIADTAEEIISAVPKDKRILDNAAFLELLQFNYMLGNRTLVQGVKRMPWRAILSGDGVIERRPPIAHGLQKPPPRAVARRLRELLEEELVAVAQKTKKIFLLLTGGLDSRVIAGILRKIEPQLQAEIKCVTWGQPESRDVVYARRIAHWYGWEFVNVPYDHELVWKNIERSAIWGGSEIAGIHLHGTEWFKNTQTEDLVLAASFGDSIGRAEFSSVHLKNMRLAPLKNKHRLLHPSFIKELLPLAKKDQETAWEKETSKLDWAYVELELQENYMRRMICHSMDYIRQFCRLHQTFTSDNLVSYIWSLSPDYRTDEVYAELLKELDGKLYSLPWARNGEAPDGTKESNLILTKDYHEWGKWLKQDLQNRLETLYFSDGLRELGLFSEKSKKRVWKKFTKESITSYWYGQDVVKLCSLELTRKFFKLLPDKKPVYRRDLFLNNIKRYSSKLKKLCELH